MSKPTYSAKEVYSLIRQAVNISDLKRIDEIVISDKRIYSLVELSTIQKFIKNKAYEIEIILLNKSRDGRKKT